MTESVMSALVNYINGGNKGRDNGYLQWAKTEYGRDWQYAYQFMIHNKGQAPTPTYYKFKDEKKV